MFLENEILVKISEHTDKIGYTSVVNCVVIISKPKINSLDYDLEIQASTKDIDSLPHVSRFNDRVENTVSLNSI